MCQVGFWHFFSIEHLIDVSSVNRCAAHTGENAVIYCGNVRFDVLVMQRNSQSTFLEKLISVCIPCVLCLMGSPAHWKTENVTLYLCISYRDILPKGQMCGTFIFYAFKACPNPLLMPHALLACSVLSYICGKAGVLLKRVVLLS